MATVQNLYTGDGSTVLFSFTFPYIDEAHIKVSLDGVDTTAYTLANATTVQFNSAPTNGTAIRIYRQTADQTVDATFFPGSAIRASDLNSNFEQVLYLSQEANSTANSSADDAADALATAQSAVSTANSASSEASSAVSTANAASSAASSAVSTANAAASDAASAVSTANTASSNATTAVNTANSAASTANSAVSTANAATSTANDAADDAAQALALVASVVIYAPVSNVASIPGSPADGDRIEVLDSTGIQSFSPLTGVPAGFTGAANLYVRITYNGGGSTWEWVSYFPVDPDNRYPVQGELGSAASPAYYFDSDTGLYSPGANQLAISTGGTEKVRVDSDGKLLVGPAGIPAVSLDPGTTESPLVRDSSGNVGIGTSSPQKTLHIIDPGSTYQGSLRLGGVFNYYFDLLHDANTTGKVIYNAYASSGLNHGHQFQVSGTNAMLIDANGRLLVGTSSAQGAFTLQIEGDATGATSAGSIYLRRGLDTSAIAGNVGADLGSIDFGANDGTIAGRIECLSDATWSSTSDTPGRLVFSTTADEASSPTERVRISATGAIGLSGANYGSAGQVLTSQGSSSAPTWSTVEGVPAGTVIYTAQSSAPTGFLKANGAAISRTTYASLFAAIGTTFGAGDGSTTFNLPDLRGEFVRGWDDGRGVDSGRSFGSSQGQATARPTTAFTTDTTGNHAHSYNGGSLKELQGDNGGADDFAGGGGTTSTAGNHAHSITGGGDAETRPRNVALLACIKY